MEKLFLSGFMSEPIILETTKKLLNSKNEIECRDLLRDLSLGQLEKLKAFVSCQEKEISNSFSLLSMLIAAFAITLPIIDKFEVNYKWVLYGVPVSFSVGIIYFIFRDGIGLINNYNLSNKKIKYILYIIDSEIGGKQ